MMHHYNAMYTIHTNYTMQIVRCTSEYNTSDPTQNNPQLASKISAYAYCAGQSKYHPLERICSVQYIIHCFVKLRAIVR